MQPQILSIPTLCKQPVEWLQLRLYWPLSPNTNAEFVATDKRRPIPNADIRRSMLAAACTKPGEIGTTDVS